MQTTTRVQEAKKLTSDILADVSVNDIMERNTDPEGYMDHESAEYDMEQLTSRVLHVLDTPNDTLPSLDRLREAATLKNVI